MGRGLRNSRWDRGEQKRDVEMAEGCVGLELTPLCDQQVASKIDRRHELRMESLVDWRNWKEL